MSAKAGHDGTKVETTQGWLYGQILSNRSNGYSCREGPCGSAPNDYSERKYTASDWRWKRVALTGSAEGGEIVWSHVKA